MNHVLERFIKNAVGSDDKLTDYSSVISPSGDFKKIKDFDVIVRSWFNILMTPERTCTFDPQYGSKLHKMIFEQADNKTLEQIRNEVIYKLTIYDDRAEIQDVEVNFLENMKGFVVTITANWNGEVKLNEITFDESVTNLSLLSNP